MKLFKKSNRITALLFLFLTANFYSNATWSIIVIDAKTKEIGIAGASCTYSVYGIGAIVPGKGAIVVQAMSNPFARSNGVKMLKADSTPQQILKFLKEPLFNPEEQQYAIMCVDFINQPVTYTGQQCQDYKGALTAKGISVQGNTLSNKNELQGILNAALKAQKQGLSIQEILLIALEEGAKLGGDKRCGDRKASSAFITVVKPAGDINEPYMNLVVNDDGSTKNAVVVLREKFSRWQLQQKQ